jgi:hypothetical protein
MILTLFYKANALISKPFGREIAIHQGQIRGIKKRPPCLRADALILSQNPEFGATPAYRLEN